MNTRNSILKFGQYNKSQNEKINRTPNGRLELLQRNAQAMPFKDGRAFIHICIEQNIEKINKQTNQLRQQGPNVKDMADSSV